MTSGSVLMRFSWFSQYLNRFNSNFDSWTIVGMRIWLYSQWNWSQTILKARSKLGFPRPVESQLRVKPSKTWPKLPKISERLEFDEKLWKVIFWGDFDLVWLSSNLGLTRGILVILVEKGTLSASVFEQVAPHHSRCSHSPMESRWYFWIFRSPTCKLRADKLRYQHRKLIEKRSKWRISVTPRPNFIVKLCVWVVN